MIASTVPSRAKCGGPGLPRGALLQNAAVCSTSDPIPLLMRVILR